MPARPLHVWFSLHVLAVLLVLASTVVPRPAFATWPSDSTTNVMLTTGAGHETESVLVADGGALAGGKSGAIVAWDDERNGFANHDVYAQRVLADGRVDPAWPAGGLPVCALSGQQVAPAIVQDGNGGAIVVWMDRRAGEYDVYAQHVLANGTLDPAWPANGLPVCAATQDQQAAQAVSDGAGGAMVVWMDYRSGATDIYANHVLATGVIDGLWPANGRVVCNATGSQSFPLAVTDGAGGVIITWYDYRNANYDIYVQRMSLATGLPVWTPNGVPLCTLASEQSSPFIVADGAGGAVVLWSDNRNSASTGFDIYAHHILAAGAVDAAWPVDGRAVATNALDQVQPRAIPDGIGGALVVYLDYRDVFLANSDLTARHVLGNGTLDPAWPASGVSVCSAANAQSDHQVVSDGAHGLIACWTDKRVNSDVYARRVLANGLVDARWQPNGIAVGAAAGTQHLPALVAVDDGDAIAVWSDFRSSVAYKLYAQRISGLGLRGPSAPRIASVRDIPNDQGGKLRVLWEPSVGDGPPSAPIEEYRLWRRVTIGATTYWEFLAQVPARGASGYGFMAATATDSVFGSLPWNAFRVTAHLADGSAFFASALDSGYSVDNLSPWAPQQLAGEYANGTTTLTWGASPDADVAAYRVYRGDGPDFVTGPATLVAEVTGTTCVDAAGAPRWYGVAAVDSHGNEGPFALLAPLATTGAGPPGLPALLALSPPRPNPARGAVELELALPAGARASCAVYDISGRLVRALIDAPLPAGTHRLAWDTADDRGAPVAGGLYFVRLEVAGVRFVRRLAVLR